ncbi:MAG: hypothetical protein KDB72_20965 [Mycobacterium sp.]|nr:hypothetical protein [Mycobacterium sp.]
MNRAQRREWRKRTFQSSLTTAQKLVLLALETFADFPEGTNARPGEARLAEMCGLQHRAVRSALRAGKAIGLIEQTGRANPKRGMAAVYRLLPAPVSTGTQMPVEADFNRHGGAFQPARGDISTGTVVPPTNPETPRDNTKEGVRAGTCDSGATAVPGMAHPEIDRQQQTKPPPIGELDRPELPPKPGPEPERYCASHMPEGPGDEWDCRDCKSQWKVHKQWVKNAAEHKKAITEYRLWVIANCNECDGKGQQETPLGVKNHHNDIDRFYPAKEIVR